MTHPFNPDVVDLINPHGSSRVLLLCEHASRHIPAAYGDLGLAEEDRKSHAAWDLGAQALGGLLSQALDAPFLAGKISRLVYDCNRPPEASSAMLEKSELIEVPGNHGLTDAQRDARTSIVYEPFCAAVDHMLDTLGPDAVLVTVHFYTPTFFGKPRMVELGLLHDDDTRFADAMLANTGDLASRVIGRNEPYGPKDGVTHSLKLHAAARGILNVMIEVRNDLLRTNEQIEGIAADILLLLRPALENIAVKEKTS